MQARAGAIDELLASGALDDASLPPGSRDDDIQHELDQLSSGSDIDAELAKMKQQIGGADAPKQVESGSGADQ
jgi:phage shock protein A